MAGNFEDLSVTIDGTEVTTREGGLDDSVVYFFREEKLMVTYFSGFLLCFIFSTMIKLNLKLFSMLQSLYMQSVNNILVMLQYMIFIMTKCNNM